MRKFIIAVDIGGSKVLCGVLNRNGEVLMHSRETTCAAGHPQAVIEQTERMVEELKLAMGLKKKDIMGTGVGVPGPLDYQAGIVEESPNLRWLKYPVREELSKRLGGKLLLDKDTNVAAWGEYYYGSNRKYRHLIYITVSTGVGGGIIVDGRLLHGLNGGGGEIGHMVVAPGGSRCGCGRRGCLEAVASGTAIAREANALIARGKGDMILANVGPGQPVSAREAGQAARQGDEEALRLIDQAGHYLGMGIANLVNIFNPEKVVLGGGAALGLHDLLLPIIQNEVINNVFSLHRRDLKIEMTRLGDDIVLAGCAAMVLNNPAAGK
ncbi:MAG: ROK family protein [Syntrophomonadaceae bacterium]|nr:ROK family protein [Syntrophomonadaceae bacterium]